ncbi:Uncharacterised protein [Vibrio cholerae]|nr:Uncharacterised protein [Vibrio cholerae]CSD38183.1 Uncharacterised protein [Vibrio cholerae]CSD74891.1 Uncharacterised protein [Vibrio cholerae]
MHHHGRLRIINPEVVVRAITQLSYRLFCRVLRLFGRECALGSLLSIVLK